MTIIKPSTAFKAGADWVSAEVRAYIKDQVATHVDTAADVRDNDFEQTRFIFVKSKAALYRLDLSSGASDDGDTVLQDNVGRRYVKVAGSTISLLGIPQVDDLTARGAYDNEDPGFMVIVSDTGSGRAAIYTMGDGGSGDWSDPAYLTPANSGGNVIGPSSSTDGNVAVFDGSSGKDLKDAGFAPANAATLAAHVTDDENPHGVTKSQVGLGNVNNTSDTDKPVSTAQAAALYKAATLAPVANLLVPAEPAAAAFDLIALAGLIRDDEDRAKSWAGDVNDKLNYQSPSTKYVRNRGGILVPGTTLRCDHDAATGAGRGVRIEPQSTRLNKYAAAPTAPENIPVTAQAYTISFFGNGQIALSGAATQTIAGVDAITRKIVTFTPSAGTLTVTPSGTVTDLQLEAGNIATSVMRGSEGSQVTRAADNISLPISAMPWNNQAGAVFMDFMPAQPVYASGFNRGIFVIERTSSAAYSAIVATRGSNQDFFARVAGANGIGVTAPAAAADVPRYKLALAWRVGRAVLAINGTLYTLSPTLTSSDLPTDPVTFRIGASRGGSTPLGGSVRSAFYLPYDPSDSELQARTTL